MGLFAMIRHWLAPRSPEQPVASSASVDSIAENRQAMETMHHAMNIPLTGNADMDFVNGMIPHHEGAVAMAEVELKYGRDPQLRSMANDIIAAQRKEIGFMRRWRERLQASRTSDDIQR